MTPEYFAGVFRLYLPEPQASLMNGILLGIPLKNQWGLYQSLIKVGLVHMIVLSGMNITLLNEMLDSLVFFLPKSGKIFVKIFTIVIFTLFVGIQPPIMRATIMGIINLLGLQTGRKVSSWYSLLISGMVCLILWPDWVSSLSFYLSYASTSGIILFPKPFSVKTNRKKPLTFLWKYVLDDLQVSIAAQILTIPLIWYYFGRISLISPVSNLLVSWTIAPIMALGFIICVIHPISSDLAKPVAFCSYLLISYILAVVHIFA
jgi:competence protein ComEC